MMRRNEERDRAIVEAYQNGTSSYQLSKLYLLSRQRIHQIVKMARLKELKTSK